MNTTYYTRIGGKTITADTVKALLKKGVKPEVDLKALSDYLTFGYVPAPLTMFNGIYKKPIVPWLNDVKFTSSNKSTESFKEQIVKTLKEPIQQHDETKASLLSGGLDSGAITSIASHSRQLNTFTAVFEDAKYDESIYAKMISNMSDTEHHEIHIDSSCAKLMSKITQFTEEPTPDISAIPRHILLETAKRHSDSIFVGEGGDELFISYREYWIMKRAYKYMPLSKPSMKMVAKMLSYTKYKRHSQALSSLASTMGNPLESYKTLKQAMSEQEKQSVLPSARKETVLKPYFDKYDYIRAMCMYGMKTALQDGFLTGFLRLAQASDIELVFPMLTPKMVNLALSIPFSLKMKGKGKWIFRQAMKPYLPKEILNRPKHPFACPLMQWITEEYQPMMDELFSKDYIKSQNIFNYDHIAKLRGQNNYNQLWPLFSFQLWYKEFVDV